MSMTKLFRNSIRAMAALLFALTIGVGFTSCSIFDDPIDEFENPLDEGIYGPWFFMKERTGLLFSHRYQYIGQAFVFNDDGSGLWYFFVLNKQKKPAYVIGGKNKKYGRFHYNVATDGTITIRLDIAPHLHVWTMKYENGKIIAPGDPVASITEEEASAQARLTRADSEPMALSKATSVEYCWLGMLDAFESTADSQGSQGSQGSNIVDLSTKKGYYYAHNGEILTGMLSLNWDKWGLCSIDIEAGATVTLRDVTIGGDELLYDDYKQAHRYPGIYCYGNATIIIEGTVRVTGDYADLPCIYVNPGCQLTICGKDDCQPDQEDSSSNLIVINGGNGNAAIGTGYEGGYESCGNVTISHCRVYASGGYGPAIGVAWIGSCGSLKFKNKCYVEAQGNWGVAIGADYESNCEEILVLDGSTVVARAGSGGWNLNEPHVAIGAEDDGHCGKVVIAGKADLYTTHDASQSEMSILKWINADNIQLFNGYEENFNYLSILEGHHWMMSWGRLLTWDRTGNELLIDAPY